ncbi:bifunctional pyr operon transcriptional regulator/uracil phosphoribosyltransferase PyrR [Methylophilus aquaticus]|uniref:Bifunctional pyr operon transcriptional regulator/uracil phosphoribosyltransferase PyrR n=1 Tax=Methylophilus aquaticus TaxID=1971610 RepID=A0ABT9JW85_9PROT|nr:bifunctional pyr operon transcriptional regulator/uracil phosphoribosyltransferase PyrR [Methylophilus aquaticus]MDP8568730.1 bifunctional pyr operon transcriptional regulator/uracil phosphoribosyltransferase PyrR [Methylophilus aquaticus]
MKLPDPEQLLENLYQQLLPAIDENTVLVGIYTGGVWLMEKLLPKLQAALGHELAFGKLDAAMYRDDYAQRGLKTKSLPAYIPFDVNGKHIILIDDIFYTGRTTRAVMNELFDYGRPASIQLAVLINRGGAQLPVRPDMTGADLPLAAQQSFELSMNTQGRLHLSVTDVTNGVSGDV